MGGADVIRALAELASRRQIDGHARPGRSRIGVQVEGGPRTITSTIQRVERPRLIAWTGRTFGIRAIHFWSLEARGGGTFVRTAESYEGLVSRIFRRPLQKTLDRALDDGLHDLKAEVERRAS
jgi:hypothetical protein